jgi:hypothetical protein
LKDIRGQVLQAAAELEIDVRELPEIERTELLDSVYAKYTPGHRYTWALWETFAERVSKRSADGWKWCGDFVSDQDVTLFFNPVDEKSAFVMVGGRALVSVIGELYGEEFYLTNASTDYLLCFNHHDYLIACGTAREWLANYEAPA